MTAPCTPFFNRSGGFGITGSPSTGWTFTKTAEAGAEVIATMGVSDATGGLTFENVAAGTAAMLPRITGISTTTVTGLDLAGQGVTDTGTNALVRVLGRIGTNTALVTRPIFGILNNTTEVASVSAKGAWTYTVLKTDAAAETLASWALDEDTASKIEILNSTTSNTSFQAQIRGINSAANSGLSIVGQSTTDSGTAACLRLFGRIGSGSSPATKPSIAFFSGATEVAQFNAAGHLTLANQLNLKSYTVATLPSAATAGGLVYVSDETGGAVPAFSDATNWRRVTDRSICA